MKPIYLDNNSTTMMDQRVLEKMLPCMKENFGNPASREHVYGWSSNQEVDDAREKISNLINCSPNEIYFTSGATESNNISILGSISSIKNHALTLKTEHKSILDIFSYISKNNVEVDLLDVMNNGIVDINYLIDSIKSNTNILSVMLANNEIGVIQPINQISQVCRNKNIIFHVDAAQALGKIRIDVKKMKIDLMSLSSHKVYGPKGVGAIYINRDKMKNKIKSIQFGGDHESGIRPGTLAVHDIVGFGEACNICQLEMEQDNHNIRNLTNLLINKLKSRYKDIIINGCMENRIPGNLNISFPGLRDEPFIQQFKSIAISSGSACTSSIPEPSHVLMALGIDKSLIRTTMRVGIGKFNTKEEIDLASNHIISIINKLKINKKEVIND